MKNSKTEVLWLFLTLFDRLRRAQNQISTFLAQVMDLNPGNFYNGVIHLLSPLVTNRELKIKSKVML